jgi:hypothetical protein
VLTVVLSILRKSGIKEPIRVIDRVDIRVGKSLDYRFSVPGCKSFGEYWLL